MDKIIGRIAKELNIKESQVEKTINLIDEGNTIPFIARYRKEVHGNLSDEVLRNLEEKLTYLRNLEQRKSEVLRSIEEQGKLTSELSLEIENAMILQRVEDLYRPFKQKKSTRASKAKERGLEELSNIILFGESNIDIWEESLKFINNELDVNTKEDAINGAMDIIAEMVSDNPSIREFIRENSFKGSKIISKFDKETESNTYENYYDFSENLSSIPNHRILALDRGEKENVLKISLELNNDLFIKHIKEMYINKNNSLCNELIEKAVDDSYKRLIYPSMEREIRNSLTDRAHEDAIKVFSKNTKPLLLIPPIKNVKVLGVDPSFRTGCKLALIDETGKFIHQATIYPNKPQEDIEGSTKVILDILNKYDIDLISIGNGTASRETESFIASCLTKVKKNIQYTIVSEAGASVYSASKLATEEFPDVNVSIRGAISIARRVQDPLAELVKIDPKSIGVGQYQHDVNQKKLEETLTNVVVDCVNSVGVDLNTASYSLLSYVSGINPSIAKNIINYRDEVGAFKSRNELKKVKRLGDKAYEQCAGFLRIRDSKDFLDNTGVHPESYDVAKALIKRLGYDLKKNDYTDIDSKVESYDKLSEELKVGKITLMDIVKELKKPGRDPREEMPAPVFRKDVVSMEDIQIGMTLTGTVRNVVNFGAFVDIGVKNDGLVHISELSNSYIKNPMDVVTVGDVVEVKVIGIDYKRGKISLSMK
jgi:uncharacterized protein